MSKCIQSGFCCTIAPCIYGESGKNDPACIFLAEPTEPYGQRLCSKFDEINELEKNSKYPMMVSGCSSTLFNRMRNQVKKRMNNANHTGIGKR